MNKKLLTFGAVVLFGVFIYNFFNQTEVIVDESDLAAQDSIVEKKQIEVTPEPAPVKEVKKIAQKPETKTQPKVVEKTPHLTAVQQERIRQAVETCTSGDPNLEIFGSMKQDKLKTDNLLKQAQFSHNAWTNQHIKKENGDIYMVRVFNDEGPKGTFKRLLYYKEDDQGFPRKQEVPKEHEFSPSKDIIDSYLSEGQIIYDETADVFNLDGGDVFIQTVDGQVDRMTVNKNGEFFECQKSYDDE